MDHKSISLLALCFSCALLHRLRFQRQLLLLCSQLLLDRLEIGKRTGSVALRHCLFGEFAIDRIIDLCLVTGVRFVGGVARAQHDSLALALLSLLSSSESRRFKFEIIHGILLRNPLCLLGKLHLGQILIVARLSQVGRAFSLPSHALVQVIILGIVPLLHLDFWPSFLEAVEEHIIVHLVQFLLQDVLALVDVAVEADLDQAIQGFDLDLGVLIAELVGYFAED